MVVLNRIYTRTGDAGETALGDGSRVPKTAARVESYGTVDELNSAIGLARLHAAGPTDAALARIQNDLFDLGADLCTPGFEADADAAAPAAAHRRRPGRHASRRRSMPRTPASRRSAASCCPAARRSPPTFTSPAPSAAAPSG